MNYLFFPENSCRSFIQVPPIDFEFLVKKGFRNRLNNPIPVLIGYIEGNIDMLPVKGIVIRKGIKVEICDNVVPA